MIPDGSIGLQEGIKSTERVNMWTINIVLNNDNERFLTYVTVKYMTPIAYKEGCIL